MQGDDVAQPLGAAALDLFPQPSRETFSPSTLSAKALTRVKVVVNGGFASFSQLLFPIRLHEDSLFRRARMDA